MAEPELQSEHWTEWIWRGFKSEQYGNRLFAKLCSCASRWQWEIKSSWAHLHCQLHAARCSVSKLIPASNPWTAFCSLVPYSSNRLRDMMRYNLSTYSTSSYGILKLQNHNRHSLEQTQHQHNQTPTVKVAGWPIQRHCFTGVGTEHSPHIPHKRLEQRSLQKGLWHATEALQKNFSGSRSSVALFIILNH